MLRLRLCAAIVSILTLATIIIAIVSEAGIGVAVALLAASACLAIVAPFDAPTPRQRNRVLAACVGYLVATFAALAFARGAVAASILMIALVVLLQLGVGLTCWAFATRKRRRMPQSRRYFDN
ncbi:hypothetical protein [Sphingomonas sp. CARO-RG-8B-R24-01]|uniref:hypothetical protein n=1 Tax=Sphingomonas sp. CARO-RG-8B-R24-01 TaxID=2914831 RepID=UPI001F58869C|nr:hypothetical protein [Sphingomonas sp. CARO-RG-8B-R24-01]